MIAWTDGAPWMGLSCVVLLVGVMLLLVSTKIVRPRDQGKRSEETMPSSAIVVVFASVSGQGKRYAWRVARGLEMATKREVRVLDAATPCEPWDEILNGDARDCVVIVSTHDGRAPEKSRAVMEDALDDLVHDFRVGALGLRGRRFAVLGLGSSAYDDFCTAAKRCEKLLRRLGASRVASEHLDDCQNDNEVKYKAWETRVVQAFQRKSLILERMAHDVGKRTKKPNPEEEDEEDLVDVEDVATTFAKATTSEEETKAEPREMVTEKQAASLKKEGYKLIGSHSAVKMCRWTKHQLRGRGGCYKHTFYGITSYQCMEATPSLACANKYVLSLLNPTMVCLGVSFVGGITRTRLVGSGDGRPTDRNLLSRRRLRSTLR